MVRGLWVWSMAGERGRQRGWLRCYLREVERGERGKMKEQRDWLGGVVTLLEEEGEPGVCVE